MKTIILTILAAAFTFTGCGLDNYDAPDAWISGRITYQGEPIRLRGSISPLEIYQEGYELNASVPVYAQQDGTFSVAIFDGDYKLVARDNAGPWVNAQDTVYIRLKGSAEVDYEVVPYYMIRNTQIDLLSTGDALVVSFDIEQIVPTATISYTKLLINETQFVDHVNFIYSRSFDQANAPGNYNYSVILPSGTAVSEARALFARMAVSTSGVGECIYSPVIRLR